MAKSPSVKTNGHTVAALKPAVPKKPAAKAAASKLAPKAAVTPVAKPALKVAAKAAAKAPAKPAAKPAAAKPPAKSVAKPSAAAPAKKTVAAKPAPKAGASKAPPAKAATPKTAAPAASVQDAGVRRESKAKLVRDSFTMPEQEYAVLGQVKKACIKAGFEIKKSELLRIGVALISQMDMATLQHVLASLPQLKTGRPKNEE